MGGDAALSPHARKLIEEDQNEHFVSLASLWEIAIKNSTGRLDLLRSIPELVAHDVFGNGFDLLPILPSHLEKVRSLPFHHRDPFDRMLAAQALAEGLTLVSRDAALDAYHVKRLW